MSLALVSYEMVSHEQSIIMIITMSGLGLNQHTVYRGHIDWTCLHVFHYSVSWFDWAGRFHCKPLD